MMKTTKSILSLALCAVAMGFASCSSDDDSNGNSGNDKEYLFSASCDIYDVEGDETGEERKAQKEYVDAALAKAGFAGESEYPLSISGKDSASVSKVLLGKIAQVEKAITDAPFEINAELSVRGAEKSIVNSDDKTMRVISSWYDKTFGAPQNQNIFKRGQYNYDNRYLFVKSLRTKGYWGDDSDDYWTVVGGDLNCKAGGDYIYLIMEHSGKSRADEFFKWESQYENDYITDVVAITGGGEPQTLYIGGRKYTKENGVCDLNKGAGGDYLWLYACREKYKMSDGKTYYLNVGRTWEDERGSIILDSSENFSTSSYCKNFVIKGHKITQRVVPLYDKNGKFVSSEAEFNRGAGGWYIKMVLAYATKEAVY